MPATSIGVDKPAQTVFIRARCFFPLLPKKCHSRSHPSLISSAKTLPSPFCRSRCCSKPHDAHAIVLSWSWLYWLSDARLIKCNQWWVSAPARKVRTVVQSNGPLIIILLLVWVGEIITLQAQSGTVGRGLLCLCLCLYPSRNLQFHFQQLHSAFSSPSVSLAPPPGPAAPLGFTGHGIKPSPHLSLCILTLTANPDHHSSSSSQLSASACVCVCVCINKQSILRGTCVLNAHTVCMSSAKSFTK